MDAAVDAVFRTHKDTLANGLRVVTVEMPHLHTATLVFYARVGSRYETAAQNGLSHFVEHMLFRGTERFPSSYRMNLAVEELGGTLYAETGRDYSLYQISLHPDTIAPGIEVLAEILTAPRFTQLELERKIVLEEILEDLDEDGRQINLDDIARQTMWGDDPLGFSIIGPYDNVRRFSRDDVARHFARFYAGRNMVLCASGRVEHQAVLEIAARVLARLPAGDEAPRPLPPGRLDGPRYVHVDNAGSQTGMQILFQALPETHPDFVVLQALLRVLDDGMSTRLHYTICDQLGLAYYVAAGIDALVDTALFEVDTAAAHANLPALLRQAMDLLAGLRRGGVSPEELAKAKRRYRWDLEGTLDDPDALAGWFGGGELFYPPVSFEEKVRRMQLVTLDDLQRVAAEVFRRERMAVATVGMLEGKLEDEVRRLVDGFR